MPIRKFFERRRCNRVAHDLYVAVINQARLPDFYLRLAVPDTLDGRFDLIVLHAFLVMRRLRQVTAEEGGEAARAVAQALFDLMFADMDQNLREMGVGDMSVGKRVKQMARAFYGRVAAYDEGLAAEGDALAEALRRNLYGTVEGDLDLGVIATVAEYFVAQSAYLAGQSAQALLDGRLEFQRPKGES
ncbi:Ubiquinol-cytochrome C chaperone [Paramagnetospirillum magnetotacticum MS-1]|uniref:Ubiquinol-cytochrome C chaperone n=1 Tax=Paramagnetospirillum magnetotacticum MS-1 TaxID=272627 RepID=A0A0C2YG96_PARME|nr:ubiquinol-cytochrome C chaperone family protein [Paramagnetospirillum magnetotacticum]KIL98794.1 Ubiquinol-cytochrome C chaperone [Paramagnetospirillum magnetotacticum MS-1]